MSTFTVAKPEEAFLSEHDFTAVSFWIISIAMIAATGFFDAEAGTVSQAAIGSEECEDARMASWHFQS